MDYKKMAVMYQEAKEMAAFGEFHERNLGIKILDYLDEEIEKMDNDSVYKFVKMSEFLNEIEELRTDVKTDLDPYIRTFEH